MVAIGDVEAPSIFLAELDGSRARPTERSRPDGASAPRPAPSAGKRARGRKGGAVTPVGLPKVAATLGLAVEDRGNAGVIVEVGESAALLLVGAARVAVPFGTDVRVEGEGVTLVAPSEGATDRAPGEDALREWRSAVAGREGVPAYVILKDTELAGIATRGPRTLAELAGCRGMGPIRLDRYGDEILAVLDAARDAARDTR